MHDYDRRPVNASSGETSHTEGWMSVDAQAILLPALQDHEARAANYKVNQLKDNVVEITGTTTDGRTFRSEVTFFIRNNIISSTSVTSVEGAVSMGPLPEALLKAEASVSHLLDLFKAVGFERPAVRDLGLLVNKSVRSRIETWRHGGAVDVRHLRGTLNAIAKDLVGILPDTALRLTVPPGESKMLWQLVDVTRKAVGAAARDLK
jgi:hypothetical protein